VALIARQARQFGIKAPLLGGDGWVGESLLKVAGNALDGSFFSNHYSQDDPSPVIQNFVKTYSAKYGDKPDAMAALGYDSAKILADAITRAGTTSEPQLRDAIAGTKDFKGVTGDITLDADRNATKAAVILTIANGGFQFVQRVAGMSRTPIPELEPELEPELSAPPAVSSSFVTRGIRGPGGSSSSSSRGR
jgi:branched-chain amino acid transport system substrate-binding protein